MKRIIALACFALLAWSSNVVAQCASCPPLASRTSVVISDSGSGTGTTTWTCDNIYQLDGYVFVNSGQTLTIEPGTVIKGLPGSGADASALIVARGGTIIADGTADCPITFTYDADPLDGSVAYDTRGQWGGVIVLGAASTNLGTGVGQVEGIPSDNARAEYGGNNDMDNSGILRYVSIRHGGTQLGAANEINGLTLAGVGSMTTVEHVEVVSNADDGIEFFGGTVDVKWAAVAFCGDDSFDYDQGYRGRGQYWVVIQDQPGATGDRGGEFDGDDADEDSPNVTANFQPYATPVIYNMTNVGYGIAAGKIGILYRNGAGGDLYNSIIANYDEGIEIEDKDAFDAYDNYLAGRLNVENNCFWDVDDLVDYDGSAVATGDADLDSDFAAAGNVISNPGIDYTYNVDAGGVTFTDNLDLVPTNDVTVASGDLPTDPWFDAAAYKGAFDPNAPNWLDGWSFLGTRDAINQTEGCTDATACNYNAAAIIDDGSCSFPAAGFDCDGNPIAGSCDCPPLASRTEVIVSDAGSGTGTTTWTCDNVYKLDGYVFVNSGQTLTIEAGTVVKGLPGSGADASALIVARGGQIIADGAANCPITFTYDADPLDGSVSYDTRGQWGGVIVLGAASTNLGTGVGQVEGIPSDNARAEYGGNNDMDNSGILRYVSIRHGGTQLGAANEINGLTLAGVGSMTTVEHVEVISNADDGIEFFGGTVDVKWAAVAFCGDDSFDYDQGYRGRGQYWFVLQDQPGGLGDRGGEFDGDDADEDSPNVTANFQPYATPVLYNMTNIGYGIDAGKIGILYRNGAGGDLYNSIIANYDEGIEIEDKDAFDAYDNYLAGRLNVENNCFWAVDDLVDYDGSDVPTGDADLDSDFAAAGNAISNPGIDFTYAVDGSGVSVTDHVGPVPANDVTVAPGNLPTDPWFDAAAYKGAFEPGAQNWLTGWSFLDERGFIADSFIAIQGCTDPTACNFDATATTDDGSCEFTSCAGCTDATACNFDATATIDDGSCDFTSCAGCTDNTACNFDATATIDDGTCEFTSCAGCTDNTACNFDPTATIDDGSCILPDGCTDAGACNFDPAATCDDGSCEFVSCAGCTDSDASNFDATATIDNGSCTYEVTILVDMAIQGGAASIDGDFTTGAVAMDVVAFDAYSYTVVLQAGTYNYNFVAGGANESFAVRTVDVVDAPVNVSIVCFGEATACAGCTDPASAEFNPYAGTDNGSCATPIVLGCTYPEADNYNPAANDDDGTCQITGGNACPGDLSPANGDGIVNAADLLAFLSVFGSTCN